MKIGLIGTGFMGGMHARLLKNIPGVELYGVVAKSSTRAEALANEINCKCFSSVQELLDSPIDVIDICTPSSSHVEIACSAMQKGKDVIVEFPACTSLEALELLKKTSAETGRVCACAYYTRFQSQYKYLFEFAQSNKIGKINHLFISRKSSSEYAGQDIINDLMSQDIDCVVNLLGVPLSFNCVNINQNECVVTLKYATTLAIIEGSTGMYEGFPFSTKHIISGENGVIDLDWSFVDYPISEMRYSDKTGTTILKPDDYDPYAFELKHILTGIKNKDTHDFDINSIYEGAKLSFLCRESISSNT